MQQDIRQYINREKEKRTRFHVKQIGIMPRFMYIYRKPFRNAPRNTNSRQNRQIDKSICRHLVQYMSISLYGRMSVSISETWGGK
jgi:hypothetical protein